MLPAFASEVHFIVLQCVSFNKFESSLIFQFSNGLTLFRMGILRFILSVVLEKTVRFAARLDVVLDNNSCLPNNKQLCVKHVSIVFR